MLSSIRLVCQRPIQNLNRLALQRATVCHASFQVPISLGIHLHSLLSTLTRQRRRTSAKPVLCIVQTAPRIAWAGCFAVLFIMYRNRYEDVNRFRYEVDNFFIGTNQQTQKDPLKAGSVK